MNKLLNLLSQNADFTTAQLASMLGRSMRSIQIKRSRMIRQEY